jgi:hypothetical protein
MRRQCGLEVRAAGDVAADSVRLCQQFGDGCMERLLVHELHVDEHVAAPHAALQSAELENALQSFSPRDKEIIDAGDVRLPFSDELQHDFAACAAAERVNVPARETAPASDARLKSANERARAAARAQQAQLVQRNARRAAYATRAVRCG